MKDLWRLLLLMRPWMGWMLLGVFLSTLTLFANIALMAASGWFIAAMALAGLAGVSMNYFSPAAIIRAAAIVRTAGRYAERLVTHEVTFRLIASLRLWFFRHLEPLAPAGLEDMRSGDLLSRLRADIDALDNFYLRILVPLAVALAGAVLSSFIMAFYSQQLAWLLVLGLLLAGVALPALSASLGQRPGRAILRHSANMRSLVVDHVQGMAELSVYAALKDHASQIDDSSRHMIEAQKKMGGIAGIGQAGLLLLANLTMWGVLLLAIPLLESGAIEPAELALLVLFTLAAFESVMPLPEAFRLLGQLRMAAARLFAIVDRPLPVAEPAAGGGMPRHFDIEIRHVCLRYPGARTLALDGLSLRLKQGARVAIVGASGAGKSSLVQLLLRQREFDSGSIHVGGRSITEFRGEQLRDWLALAPQQVHLFSASIRDNLLLANPEASQTQLDAACQAARIDDFIQSQPQGYDTWVGETGVNLSGGQRRRLAIARALLRDPRWLILDEPGEGLDYRTQRELIETLVDCAAQRGLIMITHSHVGLALMDEIVVLEKGELIGHGSYRQLLEQGLLVPLANLDT